MRGRFWFSVALAALAAVPTGAGWAQDFPTDADVETATRAMFNHLGLFEYCQGKGYVGTVDVARMRHSAEAVAGGTPASAGVRAAEAAGRQGTIQGDQVIGLMDASNPKRPEHVLAGQSMSLAANAAAQKTTERTLCRQMAAQVAPLR